MNLPSAFLVGMSVHAATVRMTAFNNQMDDETIRHAYLPGQPYIDARAVIKTDVRMQAELLCNPILTALPTHLERLWSDDEV